MFQFGYLNKMKMGSQAEFLDRLGAFADRLPSEWQWCIESRNPNYLNRAYFDLLKQHDIAHVFLQGYYMPAIFEIYTPHAEHLTNTSVIRLHGPDRKGIESRSKKDWSNIIEPKDDELDRLATLLTTRATLKQKTWLFVNNHYEGCAPLTIKRLQERMGMAPP